MILNIIVMPQPYLDSGENTKKELIGTVLNVWKVVHTLYQLQKLDIRKTVFLVRYIEYIEYIEFTFANVITSMLLFDIIIIQLAFF